MSLLDDIKQKISNLESDLKKHSNYVTEITQAIEKLSSDKTSSINMVNMINGALQAYKDVVSGTESNSEAANAASVDGSNG